MVLGHGVVSWHADILMLLLAVANKEAILC